MQLPLQFLALFVNEQLLHQYTQHQVHEMLILIELNEQTLRQVHNRHSDQESHLKTNNFLSNVI